MAAATIKLFLAHGDPKRLRTAELSNWTGKAVAGPRSEFEGVPARDESERSGIYLLTGTDQETGKPAIYIGEAENIRSRIKSHMDKAKGYRTPNGFLVLNEKGRRTKTQTAFFTKFS